MIVSTKGRYALRVMIDLAEHPNDGFVPLAEISERQQISKEYLSNILKLLVQADFLLSLRGKGGGYKLAKPANTYKVGSILRLVEGDLAPVSCIQSLGSCPNSEECRPYMMWHDLDIVINDFLDSIYLTDFLAGGKFYRGK